MRSFAAHLTQSIININRYKLFEKCVKIEQRVHPKHFKNLEKNIFRTLCTIIAQVLGMEAKFNYLIWIIQTSILKVVQQKINKIKSLSENHTNLHRNICYVYKLVKKNSNGFEKVGPYIGYKWIHLPHNFL